jgi:two-component system sensor histidine kinase BarA
MSYRTLKRTMGETNLERKCRLLFGSCLLVFIAGSFWLYGKKTNEIVFKTNRVTGEALANAALLAIHFREQEKNPLVQQIDQGTAEELRKRKYYWEMLLPEGALEPVDEFQWKLMDRWNRIGQEELFSDAEVKELPTQWAERVIRREMGSSGQTADASGRSAEGSGQAYEYYEAVYARESCITCHSIISEPIRRPNVKVGDLLGVVHVWFSTKETLDKQNRNWAFLWVAAIAAVFLSMVALYVIVRYVIVKPIRHLRDVSEAVRRGDVEQRAVIQTGDEFEELAAAFNRMLRQLLLQQDELRDVNGELDGKLDELAQTNMRLFEMNQLKSDFLATVSHELRTPLNSIIGFSDLLGNIEALNDKQKRYASNIQRSGNQLLEMINDILDLAKIESGKMELHLGQFDIGAVVAAQCDMARPLSERKNIDLKCDVTDQLPAVHQDQGKIEQILNNLLSNAIKFTPDGGRIDVKVWRDQHDERDELRIMVTDTGIGISESEQVLVFEKFRQGTTVLPGGDAMTREYSGTGLGLSIVREICRLLGGDILLESDLGKGSRFTVHLPWKFNEQTHMKSALEDELRQMTKSRADAPTESFPNTENL